MPPSVDEVRLQLVRELVASYVAYVKALQTATLTTEQKLEREGILDCTIVTMCMSVWEREGC
jgi:hypothetical protein